MSAAPKFTPGPWNVRGHPNCPHAGKAVAVASDKWNVADVYGDADELADQMEPNARLIAAAPEMYDLLRWLWDLHDSGEVFVDGPGAQAFLTKLAAANALLAKVSPQ